MLDRLRTRTFAALALLLSLVLVVPVSASPGESATSRLPKHVILIDWDGLDPDYLDRAEMPNLDVLVARGSLSIAEGTYKTISNPSRASMSTGAYPEVHENVAHVYDPATNRIQGQNRHLAAETVMQALASEGFTTASVQWYMVQNFGVTFRDPEHLYVQPGGPCVRRIDAAIEILHQRPVNSGGRMVTVPKIPDFLAVYCDDPDALGHREGPNSPGMVPLLEEMDALLGRLIQATRDVGIYGQTAFILTSDHGMTEWTKTLQPQAVEAIRDAGYEAEALRSGESPAETTEVIISSFVRVGTVSVRGRAATEQGYADVVAALEGVEGMERVLDRDELRQLRVSPFEGDIVAEPMPPWAFAFPADVPPPGVEFGSHASLREIEMPLVLSGAGFCWGPAPESPNLVDVAPTITALLGSRPPADAQGRALIEVIGPPACPGR